MKKRNKLGLLISFIGIICLGVGAFLSLQEDKNLSNNKDENNKVEKEENVKDENNKDDNEENKDNDVTKLHTFDKYQNYKFVMDMVLSSGGIEIQSSSNGHADVKNSTDYMVITTTFDNQSQVSYSYSDYTLGYVYTSDDKVKWDKDAATGTESINLEDIIEKINNKSSDVNVLGKDHYSVKIDFENGDVKYGGVYADVQVANGYITKLYYDLTSVVSNEGYDKLTIDFKLSDFNTAGDVVIPDNVKNSNTI